MKPRSLLILALLVAGLGAFVWFGRELPSSAERAERANRVLRLEAEDVRRVDVEWGEGSVTLERTAAPAGDTEEAAEPDGDEPGEWSLREPIEARADSDVVEGIVQRLVSLEKERTLEEVDRAAVGLAEPRGTVRLDTTDGEVRLEIGGEVPASTNMTLAVAGEDAVYVVPEAIWADLTREPADWREKNLFVGRRGDIERLAVEGPEGRVLLAKRGDDFWLESPVVDRADGTLANALVSTLTGLRAVRFLEPSEAEEADTGLASPRGTIEVVLAGRETPMRVIVGGEEAERENAPPTEEAAEPNRFLIVDGQPVTSKAALVEHVERGVEAWRSKDLVVGEVYELARLEAEDAVGVTALERAESDWLRDGERIDYGTATDLLYEISGGAAERVVESESLDALGEPVLTFRLVPDESGGDAGDGVGEGADEVEELRLFAPVDELTPATVSTRPGVLLLSAETSAAIFDKLAAVRGAEVQLDPDAAAPEDELDAAGEGDDDA